MIQIGTSWTDTEVLQSGLDTSIALLPNATHSHGRWSAALHLASGILWRIPGSFGIARTLGPRYSLRCVLFHDVSNTESPFTRGLNITTTLSNFEAALKFLTKHYTPVRLHDILADPDGRILPPRPVLVTFDDAYASIADFAAPLCWKYRVPAVFFVNASCLDNRQLALDNLVCYAVNTLGLGSINAAARAITGIEDLELRSMAEVFARFLPAISLQLREDFRDALAELVQSSDSALAEDAGLYLSSQQLQTLAASSFEIGNHTYTHVHCRALSRETLCEEIDRNKAELEAVSGTTVRAFSVPYGSSADLTSDVVRHLRLSGHEAVFLSESVANRGGGNVFRFDRVSSHAESDEAFFFEIEVLPRLRAMRNRVFGTRHASPRYGQEIAGAHYGSR